MGALCLGVPCFSSLLWDRGRVLIRTPSLSEARRAHVRPMTWLTAETWCDRMYMGRRQLR